MKSVPGIYVEKGLIARMLASGVKKNKNP